MKSQFLPYNKQKMLLLSLLFLFNSNLPKVLYLNNYHTLLQQQPLKKFQNSMVSVRNGFYNNQFCLHFQN